MGRPAEGAGEADGRLRAPWRPERARIGSQQDLRDGWVELELVAPHVASHARPGHFVQLSVRPSLPLGWDPFLRRPFSLSRIDPQQGRVALVYRPGGRGTTALAALKPGDVVDVLGPLGRSFPRPDRRPAPSSEPAPLVLVGQGYGVLALLAAARWATGLGRPVELVVGGRTAAELPARELLAGLGVPVTLVTEDGSAGGRGSLREAWGRCLQERRPGEVWGCGPDAVLAALKADCRQARVPLFAYVERPMACGFGVCMGCSVPRADRGGYWHACVDGPVFRAEEVALDGETAEPRGAGASHGAG